MADKIKVVFSSLKVNRDGDGGLNGKGEFYYTLMVDGDVVAQRSVSNPLKLAAGDSIPLNAMKEVTKESGQTLTVQGDVSEKDTGEDDSDGFRVVYSRATNWGAPDSYQRQLRFGKMDVTLTYTINRA